ncbi:hypothetical protein NFI96_003287 [Prochilodus magdalenae]|nr:hypothetical protein NFI96_003287 [Prochilodus magdalenae]
MSEEPPVFVRVLFLCGAAVCQWCCTNRMTHGGHHCSLNVAHRGCWVSQMDSQRRKLICCCTVQCWSSSSPSSVVTGRYPHDAAHRTLPHMTLSHRTLPTGRCPQDAAHRTLPTGRCPQDAAGWIVLLGGRFSVQQ